MNVKFNKKIIFQVPLREARGLTRDLFAFFLFRKIPCSGDDEYFVMLFVFRVIIAAVRR